MTENESFEGEVVGLPALLSSDQQAADQQAADQQAANADLLFAIDQAATVFLAALRLRRMRRERAATQDERPLLLYFLGGLCGLPLPDPPSEEEGAAAVLPLESGECHD